jgi:uncharacterized protein involved in exopolysaccharide biosynthesis
MKQKEEMDGDGLSLREVIDKFKEYALELISKWKVILIVSVLFAFFGFLFSYFKAPVFIARSTIMLDQEKQGGGLGSYMQLAGQLGLMNGGSSSINEDKLIALFKSRRIVTGALLKKATINQRNDLLINHLIDILNKDKEKRENLYFKTNNTAGFTFKEDSILSRISNKIIDEYLAIEKQRLSGIITITIQTPSELFSQHFCEYLVQSVSEYYINNITKHDRETVDVTQSRVDSIAGELSNAENRYARWKDASNRLIKVQGFIEEIRLKRDIEVLSRMYGEAIKNLEISRFNALLNIPFIQVVDRPILPLEEKKIGLFLGTFAGGAIGALLIFIFLVSRRMFLNALQR